MARSSILLLTVLLVLCAAPAAARITSIESAKEALGLDSSLLLSSAEGLQALEFNQFKCRHLSIFWC